MDFTNVKDPAGINALLDSLRSSSVFTTDSSTDKDVSEEAGSSETVTTSQPSQYPSKSPATLAVAPSPSISSEVSDLLKRLASSTSDPLRPPSVSSSRSNFPNSTSYPASTSNIVAHQSPRTMSFQQALPHIGRLLERPDISASLRRMKIEQNELEQRLWMGREAIIAAQQKKVDNALAITKLTHATVPLKERENMRIEFERELERYDRHRVISAWDNLLKQQQEKLEALGFPTFFPTTATGDRARQQRVIDVLSSAIDPEPI